MNRENQRANVVELHKAGKRKADIVQKTGFNQVIIYDAMKCGW